MKADYNYSVSHPGNPFIDALPPILGGEELLAKLGNYPRYQGDESWLPSATRMQLLGNLYEVYQPLKMTIALYYQVYTAMQHSFAQKLTPVDAQQYHQNYRDIQNKRITAATGGGNSFSVIGISGLGKSTALQRVLSLFPQVIEHKRYAGKPLVCKQIPYLVVQTPHDASIKALCLDIMLQVDELLGTEHYKRAIGNRLTGDMLVAQIAQITKNINLGLLVVDELQNISYSKSGGGAKVLNYLVQLINSAHLSICMVGTPRVLSTLQQEFRSARRATGYVYDRLRNDEEFTLLLNTLWRYQYTRDGGEMTPELRNWLYRKTQGVPDILVKLLYHAQQLAIMDGSEVLDIAALDKAYRSNLQMVEQFLDALDDIEPVYKPPASSNRDLVIEIPGNEENVFPEAVDLRGLSKAAKKQGIPVAKALSDWIELVVI